MAKVISSQETPQLCREAHGPPGSAAEHVPGPLHPACQSVLRGQAGLPCSSAAHLLVSLCSMHFIAVHQ